MLFLAEELRKVDTLFAANAVPLVAFKGAALAAFLYGDLSQREYGDLDILVPKECVATAQLLLGSLGYAGPYADAEFRHTFLAAQQQYAFIRADARAAVDLHWHFNGTHSPFPLQPEDSWRDLAYVSIGDRRIATFSGANLALLLAGHGTKEAWRKLAWVRDFATLVDSQSDLDWAAIYLRARSQRCGNAVLLGCLLAERLLGVTVPDAIAGFVQANRWVQERGAVISAEMRKGAPPPARFYLGDLGLCDHWYDKLKSIVQQGVTRTASDYAAWPLPPPLWGIYYLTRPFRLLNKALRRLCNLVVGR